MLSLVLTTLIAATPVPGSGPCRPQEPCALVQATGLASHRGAPNRSTPWHFPPPSNFDRDK